MTKSIIEKTSIENTEWQEMGIEGFTSSDDSAYRIEDINCLNSYLIGLIKQMDKYIEQMELKGHSNGGIILSPHTKMNIIYNQRLIKFIETSFYDFDSRSGKFSFLTKNDE